MIYDMMNCSLELQENQNEQEENIVIQQRQKQLQLLLQKVEDSMNTIKKQELNEFIKLKDYVFSLYVFFEKEWKDFDEEADLELGNCYKFCINKLNIFKNILRSFFSYMKNKGDDIVIECLDSFQKPIQKVKKQFIRFSERHPANNKSMQVLFEYSRYGRQFEYFLNFYAIDWLIKSKVKDLVPHLLSIFFLLRCFQTPQLKDLLKVYKKTKKITLPRKVRKQKIDSKLSVKQEIKSEEATSMQQSDSYIQSSVDFGVIESEESKNIAQNNINESQSTTSTHSANYQENIFNNSFTLQQSTYENEQKFISHNQSQILDRQSNKQMQYYQQFNYQQICNQQQNLESDRNNLDYNNQNITYSYDMFQF